MNIMQLCNVVKHLLFMVAILLATIFVNPVFAHEVEQDNSIFSQSSEKSQERMRKADLRRLAESVGFNRELKPTGNSAIPVRTTSSEGHSGVQSTATTERVADKHEQVDDSAIAGENTGNSAVANGQTAGDNSISHPVHSRPAKSLKRLMASRIDSNSNHKNFASFQTNGQTNSQINRHTNGSNKVLTSDNTGGNTVNEQDNDDSPLPKSHELGHTERQKSEDEKQSNDKKDLQNEQQQLDQGLIEAQIDDVLSSAEFLALEQSEEFASLKDELQVEGLATDKQQAQDDPEFLLNQLDESDLMDYVAEDDLWKEQLTIEDHP